MELDLVQAMDQLQSMFPNFDEDSIKAVLSSNDGHLERTIDDLMKLTEEVENSPDDDDNIFADPKPHISSRGQFNDYQSNRARDAQVSEDAKLAYELQMQYLQQEQIGGQNAYNTQNTFNAHPTNYNYTNKPMNSYQSGGIPRTDSTKKRSFYKKLKVAMNNLFARKGKSGKKGPTKNPGIYNAMDPVEDPNNIANNLDDEPNLFRYKEEEDEEEERPAMNLDDIMRSNRHKNEEENSPREYQPQRGNLARDYDSHYNRNYPHRNEYVENADYS